jgi:hypothetical protein
MRIIPTEELISRLGQVSYNAEAEFGVLTAEQLNLKPSSDSWSIAQCLDHLITTNKTYFPQIEAIISGRFKKTFYRRLPLLPKLFGKILIKTVSPDTERKTKTAKVFYPGSSELPGSIVKDFTSHNNLLIELIQKTYGLNTEKIIISSPVSPSIVYSLKDAFIILTLHEERHLNQAKRVKEII